MAHYNKIKRKKEPVAPFIPPALPRYEKGSDEDEEAELAFVNVHIMNKISGEWVRQYLTMDAFQSRLIPSANVYGGMRVNLVHEPHGTQLHNVNLGDTIVLNRNSLSDNLPLYLAGTFCGVVQVDTETDPGKKKFCILMKTTFKNGRLAFDAKLATGTEGNVGSTGAVVPYGPGFVPFDTVWGLKHNEDLETPTALTVYSYLLTARDWTYFEFEIQALKVESKTHVPRCKPMEGLTLPAPCKFDKKRDSLGSPKASKASQFVQAANVLGSGASSKQHLLSTRYICTSSEELILEWIELNKVTEKKLTTEKKNGEPKKPQLKVELTFILKVVQVDLRLEITCDATSDGFTIGWKNAKMAFDTNNRNPDQKLPNIMNDPVREIVTIQFRKFLRKVRDQLKQNFGSIKQHKNYQYVEIQYVPRRQLSKTTVVAKPKPKTTQTKDQAATFKAERELLQKKNAELKEELKKLKDMKLVEHGASKKNQATAWTTNCNMTAKQLMMTVSKTLFAKADEVKSAKDVNQLYHLHYIGMLALNIAKNVSDLDWLMMTFPSLPEEEFTQVRLFKLSDQIKKLLVAKRVEDVTEVDVKSWFPTLDVPRAQPWDLRASPTHENLPPLSPMDLGKRLSEMMSPHQMSSLMSSLADRSSNAADTTKRKDPGETQEDNAAKKQKKAD